MKKIIYFSITAILIASSLFVATIAQNDAEQDAASFSDVHIGLRSYVPVKYFLEHRLIQGYGDGTFRPDAPITRAEAILLAEKALINFDENTMDFLPEKSPDESAREPSTKKQKFKDVPKNHFAATAIENAAEKKIVSGFKKNRFKPDKPIKLAEGLKILLGYEFVKNSKKFPLQNPSQNPAQNSPQNPDELKNLFADVQGEEWFAPYVKEAKNRGMLRFGMRNAIEPNQILTRGYFVDLAYRLIKSRDPNRFFGKATFYSDFFEGRGTANGEKFTQNGYTAAHKTLPFGTRVRVTNLKNGQHIDVRINDRGPFTISLDLDLTSKAFSEIAATSEGIVPAQFEILPAPAEITSPKIPTNSSKNSTKNKPSP